MTKILKEELLALRTSISKSPEIGDLFFYSSSIVRVIEIIHSENNQTLYKVQNIFDPEYTYTSALESQYYTPVTLGLEDLEKYSERILNGDTLEEDRTDLSETAVMDLHSKDTLIMLKQQAEVLLSTSEQIKKFAEVKIKNLSDQLYKKLDGVRGLIHSMSKQIKRLDFVIQTVETYAGIQETITQLLSGDPASEDEEVIIHQAVVFLDEELALIYDDFDFYSMSNFDEWLVKDKNYEKLIPENKGIIALKPRRTAKRYTDDSFCNAILNGPNFKTYFLIRNGDNLYKIVSEHIELEDKLFPNKNDLRNQLEKEQNDHWEQIKDADDRTSALLRKRFTRILFLLQGLFDRSDVFAPHHFNGSFLKLEIPEGVKLLYELDNALTDGKPDIQRFIKEKNTSLLEGQRIIVVGDSFSNDDFCSYYRKYTEPALPKEGIYNLEKNYRYKDGQYHSQYQAEYMISYLPTDIVYDNNYGHARTKKVTINVNLENTSVLAYDNITKEEILYYLNSRYHRSKYYLYVKKMKKFLAVLNKEEKEEDNYKRFLISQVYTSGLDFKAGVNPLDVAQEAIDRLKNRLKWKRPITSKEKETYALTKRTMLSKEFQKKYYIRKQTSE